MKIKLIPANPLQVRILNLVQRECLSRIKKYTKTCGQALLAVTDFSDSFSFRLGITFPECFYSIGDFRDVLLPFIRYPCLR